MEAHRPEPRLLSNEPRAEAAHKGWVENATDELTGRSASLSWGCLNLGHEVVMSGQTSTRYYSVNNRRVDLLMSRK